MTGGEAVVRTLKSQGVRAVFGMPGVHTLPIYDALNDHPEIQHVVVRHEQSAVFMADAYTRVTGEIAAAILITGPGAASAMAAVQEAYGSSSPVLLITSQIESHLIGKGKGTLHEVEDQLGLFRSVTLWNRRTMSVAEIPQAIGDAIKSMMTGRPRPIQIEIPTDILWEEGDADIPPPEEHKRPGGDPRRIEEASQILESAKFPILYAGGGLMRSGATEEFQKLAEALQAPVLTSIKGKGAIPEDHPLSLGNWGVEEAVAKLLGECDVALAVGTRFGNRSTNQWNLKLPRNLIQIDIDPGEIGKNYPASLDIVGDAKSILREILNRIGKRSKRSEHPRAEKIKATREEVLRGLRSRYPKEMGILEDIRGVLARDAILSNDSTIASYWTRRHFPVYSPRTFLWAMGSGTIGFGLPAALGAKIAHPERQAIAICGDGGFLFSCQELATAMKYKLGVPILLFNDGGFGIIKRAQQRRFGRTTDTDLTNPDFVKFAEAFGARGVRLKNLSDLRNALENALARECPTILEITASLEPPPIV
ncbi:MAG: thiamine pyrophosphate-binding protein [bacterium]